MATFVGQDPYINLIVLPFIYTMYYWGYYLLGNSGKICHPRNVEFDEIHEMSFQGGWTYEDMTSWICEAEVANLWRSGILNLRSPEVTNLWRSVILNLRSPEVANLWRSGILNLRSPEVANLWRSGILNLRILEVANLLRHRVMNMRNSEIGNLWNSGIYWSSNSEVIAHEDFHE
jgi:hypothetical protein